MIVELDLTNEDSEFTPSVVHKSIAVQITKNKNKTLVMGDSASPSGFWYYHLGQLFRSYTNHEGKRCTMCSVMATKKDTEYVFYMENGMVVHLKLVNGIVNMYLPSSNCNIKYPNAEWK